MKDNHNLNILRMPLELRLLLYCLRASADQDVGDQIDSLSRKAIDWDVFVRLIDRHRVVSQAYKSLKQFAANNVPEPVLIRLRERARRNAQRVLAKTTELVNILKGFNQRGISALSFKGPVLSLLTYGDLGSRHVGDLDIMIPVGSIGKADNLL